MPTETRRDSDLTTRGLVVIEDNAPPASIALTLALLILAAIWLIALPPNDARAAPTILFVATDGSDSSDCRSIVQRCLTLQRAVDQAVSGDVIKVATGAYTDTDTATAGALVVLTKTVALFGGYSSAFFDPPDPQANPSILNGQGAGTVVLITAGAPTIQGFMILGGNSNLGGGIRVDEASATIRENVIEGNTASLAGGGIYVNRGSVQIIRNRVQANSSLTGHGGISINNDAAGTISGNEILDNTAVWNGGGLAFDCCARATITVTGNLIAHNQAGSFGGGLVIDAASPVVINNILAGNDATRGGQALWLAATYASYPLSATLAHNTMLSTTTAVSDAVRITGYVTATLVNNIISGHAVGITNTTPLSSNVSIHHNLLWNTWDPNLGTSAVQADPQLDPSYQLIPTSPAKNAGTSAGVSTDRDGQSRPVGAGYDIGADEVAFYAFLPLSPREHGGTW